MKSNHRQNIAPSTQDPVIIYGYDGLTADGVHATIVAKEPRAPKSKEDLLLSMPVSSKVCVSFTQSMSHVIKSITAIETRTRRRFYAEGGICVTNVWRVA